MNMTSKSTQWMLWVPVASALFVTATALQAETGGEPSWPAKMTSAPTAFAPPKSETCFDPDYDNTITPEADDEYADGDIGFETECDN